LAGFRWRRKCPDLRDKEHVELAGSHRSRLSAREGKTTIAHNRFQRVRNQMHPRVRHAREDFVRPGQIKLREPGEEKHSDVSRQGSPWSCNGVHKPFGEAIVSPPNGAATIGSGLSIESNLRSKTRRNVFEENNGN